jgi:O-methyltransferase
MLTSLIKAAFRSAGIGVHRAPPYASSTEILTPPYLAFVSPYTMTSPERIATLCQAVEHLVQSEIEGDIVECGVWRGGSMMGAAMTLRRHEHLRRLYLFDTFEGMPPRRISMWKPFPGRPRVLNCIDYTGRLIVKP